MISSFWRDRPTFVTGATGLVGSWLVEKLLDAGADVVCLVRDGAPSSRLVSSGVFARVKTVRGDVCDQQLLERALGEYEIDTVVHLAAQAIVGVANRSPASTFEANVRGTWTLLEACRRSPLVKSIVVASSDKAYGDQERLPYTEETPLQGRHPYDVSKSCADLIALSYAQTYDLPVAITRCGNFYGGGDLHWNRIVPGTIRSIVRGERPVIRSDGQFVRDYFYVEDGAAAYMALVEAMSRNPQVRGQAFNFSNEAQITVLELVERILKKMNSNLSPDVRSEASHEIRVQHLSAAKARAMLGWSPQFSLDEGLERTITWYQEFFAGGDRSVLNTSSPRVCAVVVAFNRSAMLFSCLERLRAQSRPLDAILVVNNASTDDTAAMVRREFPGVTLLDLPENGGGAGGFHAGMKHAFEEGFEWLWLMDDDVLPAPDAPRTHDEAPRRRRSDRAAATRQRRARVWRDALGGAPGGNHRRRFSMASARQAAPICLPSPGRSWRGASSSRSACRAPTFSSGSTMPNTRCASTKRRGALWLFPTP